MGFELVTVRFMKGARSTTLQVMAEPQDRARPMTVEDCAEISHAVSAVLDVADPVAGAYRLEISSPGLDRPLVKAADYARFAGRPAKLELSESIDAEGRKRFQGVLAGLDGEEVLIDVDGERKSFPLARIAKGKLLLSDQTIGGGRGRKPGRRRA
jgi:ribosome maturation factor RimP